MFNIGEKVKTKNSNIYGIITDVKIKNSKKIYYINIQNKNVIIEENNIEKVPKNNINNNNKKITIDNSIYDNYNNSFFPELTIRHQTLDIAMYNVENFVNEAIQNNEKNIKIIHGRNGGILRTAVHNYLKRNKNVKEFRLGNYYEGSYGVTIIKLK
jgi:DNA mismatch repair protein MutS2